MYHPSFGKYETTTAGEYTAVKLHESGLEFEQENKTILYELPSPSLRLCGFLIERSNQAFVAKEVKRQLPGLHDRVSDTFGVIKGKLANTGLDEHFISLGRGSATWYGFIDNDSIETKLRFADDGMKKIDNKSEFYSQSNWRIERRKKPFSAYKYLITNGEKEPFFTRNKKIAGTGAIAFTLGAATVYVTRHYRQE